MRSRMVLIFVCFAARGATLSPLAARGYSVLPEPQRVTLRGPDFRIGAGWRVELGPGVAADEVAVEALREDLAARFGLHLGTTGAAIRLAIRPGAAAAGAAQDRDKEVLAAQAYRLELAAREIRITANAAAGLFYGVETLVQLVTARGGGLWLPAGEITDWPDLQLRNLYWDDAHHLERPEALRRAIRQAAFFKINGFVIKLEGHFQFRSAPALAEPQALSPAELQELTDYALRYHVQLIPYLDAPAHIAFILKHPEYAPLRAFPDSNYELCVTNPDSYQLLGGMYQDLLDANRGVKYFYLSTDEPYYIGMADNPQCHEAARARELGSVGKLLAEFLGKAAGYLHERGRTVVFWGEYPLKPADIAALPPYLVNGETYGPAFDSAFQARGMRQMIYTSTEGEEKLFPQYFALPASRRLHAEREVRPRVAEAAEKIAGDTARQNADLMGMLVAGWADMGLHPETFWLGYATIAAAGWHPGAPDPREAMAAFYPLYYGASAENMDRVYQLMSLGAQAWADSWETQPSKARKPIWGNSETIYHPPRPARDQTIPLPPAPEAGLVYNSDWGRQNAQRLRLAEDGLAENDELLGLLHRNIQRAEFHREGLEVFLAIAQLYRQNLEMLVGIAHMDSQLSTAQKAAAQNRADRAVAALDQVLETAREIRRRRNQALRDATAVWYQTWYPRVPQAHGRTFLHALDDVKDHLPDRTVDMRYLIYRELLLPFGEWVSGIQSARNAYAQAHQLPARGGRFDWGGTE